MTEGKTAALLHKKKRRVPAAARIVARSAAVAALGFVLSLTELPMGTYPLAIGLVCAISEFPPAAMIGAALGNLVIDARIYTVAAAAACMFRLIAYAAGGTKRIRTSGWVIRDGTGTRMVAALVGGVCAGMISLVREGSVYTAIGAVFAACVAVCSATAFTFFFDARYKNTEYYRVGAISLAFCVTLAFLKTELFGVPISLVTAATAALLASFLWGGPYGCVTGFLLGLPLGVEWAAILAVTGIFAGLFSWAGPFPAQITSMAVFICGAVYVYGVENWRLYLVPIIAGELLSAVPTSFGLIKQETRREATDDICDDVIAGIKANENERRMEMLSKSMKSLSEVIGALTQKFRRKKDVTLEETCRGVWKSFCDKCPVDCKCHDIFSIPGDDVIENVTEKLMYAGARIDREHISEYIGAKCPNTDKIIAQINERAGAMMDSIVGDDRLDIFAVDYEATAAMISDAIAQSSGRYAPDKILSEKLRRALLKSGFATKNVVVCGDRKLYVVATGEDVLRSGVGAEDIRKVCESVCGQRFGTPSFRFENGRAAMLIEAEPGFFAEYAGRQYEKSGEEVNGDSVSIVENRDGFFYSFVCDGMGSGEVAAVTSKICRVFLEKMLECGNSKSTTLEMLNTFIRNKGVECYATVDLLEVDMMQGTAAFVKCGAPPSYVKRGKSIFKIESNTFPVGIIKQTNAEMTEFELADGDVVIMCSDGVAQDFDVSASLDPSWFVNFLDTEWTDDLDKMAENIILAAEKQNHRSDDMTVELVRIRKKAAAPQVKTINTQKLAE
ncbi:MAG: SpoIIE family protein phosphatase [Clostridia bacterium]|nr:SpoIIE family protein phosphatase [Clostridia bacterium]